MIQNTGPMMVVGLGMKINKSKSKKKTLSFFLLAFFILGKTFIFWYILIF